jgi:hypothetical protein
MADDASAEPTPADKARALIASSEYAAVKAGLQEIAAAFLAHPAATYPFQSLGPLERMVERLASSAD